MLRGSFGPDSGMVAEANSRYPAAEDGSPPGTLHDGCDERERVSEDKSEWAEWWWWWW